VIGYALVIAGLTIWALAKARADSSMWLVAWGVPLEGSVMQRYWHTVSLAEDIGAGMCGVGAAWLWGSAGALSAIEFSLGCLSIANVLFRVVYVRLSYGSWDTTAPAYNRTAFFIYWRGKDRALRLGRVGAIIFYAAQIVAGLALVWLAIR
jgi:hypothetical protein